MTDLPADVLTALSLRFKVEGELGRGGMGTVLKGHDRELPSAEVRRIIADLAEALAYAHANGVVHRDLKPENVFWYQERALLADFGIAHSQGPTAPTERLTEMGTMVGTLDYISPEQVEGTADIDGRSDLYSLGCVAYELLTGQAPFGGRGAAPGSPFMCVGLADVLMALGRYDEARGPLREALGLSANYDAALERLEMSCHRAGLAEEAYDARRSMLGVRGETGRLAALTEANDRQGWPAAREADLRQELQQLLEKAQLEDPFQDAAGSRQLSDKLIIVLAELGEWNRAQMGCRVSVVSAYAPELGKRESGPRTCSRAWQSSGSRPAQARFS